MPRTGPRGSRAPCTGFRTGTPALAAAALLGVLATACGHGDDPAAAFQGYLSALAEGEVDGAFEMLAAASRERLAEVEARWKVGGEHPLLPDRPPGSSPRETPGRLLFGILVGGGEVPEVAPLPARPESFVGSATRDGDRAWVRVATPLGERTAQLAREEGVWKVLLKID